MSTEPQHSTPVSAEPTDDEIIDMAVEPLGIDCDRMPYGVIVFARTLLSRYSTAPVAAQAQQVDKQPETQGKPVDESPNLQGQRDPSQTGVGCWCAPGPAAEQQRTYVLKFEDADRGEAHFHDEAEAYNAFSAAEARGWNCHLFAQMPRNRFHQDQQPVSGVDAIPDEPEFGKAWRAHASLYGHEAQHTFAAGWNAAKDDMLTHCVESAIHIAEEKVKAQQPVSGADDELHYKLSCFIDHATGGRLSKLNWPLEALKQAHDENVENMVCERLAEEKEIEQDADKVDAERYRFASNALLVLGGGRKFGWPIAPLTKAQWDKYIDAARKEPDQ